VVFATHALSPAKISRVSILDAIEKHMEVIVDDTQLSLAIGKKGQNVRLAAKLLGWRIDIKSEEEKRQEVESQMALVVPGAPVSVLLDHGLAEGIVEKLMTAGIPTVERLGSMTPEQLDELGIGPEMVENIQSAVNGYYGQFEGSVEDSAEAEAEGSAEETAEAGVGETGEQAAPESGDGAAPLAAGDETKTAPAETGAKSVKDEPESENESVTIESTERSGGGEGRGN
jgi:N utilization substance protein A